VPGDQEGADLVADLLFGQRAAVGVPGRDQQPHQVAWAAAIRLVTSGHLVSMPGSCGQLQTARDQLFHLLLDGPGTEQLRRAPDRPGRGWPPGDRKERSQQRQPLPGGQCPPQRRCLC
jgi:hypothetical protein